MPVIKDICSRNDRSNKASPGPHHCSAFSSLTPTHCTLASLATGCSRSRMPALPQHCFWVLVKSYLCGETFPGHPGNSKPLLFDPRHPPTSHTVGVMSSMSASTRFLSILFTSLAPGSRTMPDTNPHSVISIVIERMTIKTTRNCITSGKKGRICKDSRDQGRLDH